MRTKHFFPRHCAMLALLLASLGSLPAQIPYFIDQVLSTNQGVLGLTVATNGNIYYVNYFTNTLGLLHLPDGALTPLLTNLSRPTAVESVGDKIYFTEGGTGEGHYHDGSLSVFDPATATRTLIRTGLDYPTSLFTDSVGSIYVIEAAGSSTIYGGNNRLLEHCQESCSALF